MRATLFSALLLGLALLASHAFAAARCPFIRPPGLSFAEVDSLVLDKAAEFLHRPRNGIDRSRTFKTLDGTDNAILTYSFAALAIGESLGFDSIATFYDAAKSKTGGQPFENLTIAEMQTLSRTVYFSGKDAPPPDAIEGVEFPLQRITVHTPSPAIGWKLFYCGGEQILFRRIGAIRGNVATAMARLVNLPPYSDDEAFLASVRSAASSLSPQKFAVRRTTAEIVSGTSVPCAALSMSATAGDIPYEMQARFCYSAVNATLGYATIYSQIGTGAGEVIQSEANAFILAASPK